MKKLAILVMCLALSAIGMSIIWNQSVYTIKSETSISSPQPTITQNELVDYQAGFAIFTNGIFRVFTLSMYHHRSEDVFIDSNEPNIVRVKKRGITWGDFFRTLPLKLTDECLTTGTGETFCTNDKDKLSFHINKAEAQTFLDQEIRDGDRVLITYGNNLKQIIDEQFQKVPSPD